MPTINAIAPQGPKVFCTSLFVLESLLNLFILIYLLNLYLLKDKNLVFYGLI
ncbi:MAG: hypothetical protein RL349_1837 [Bacteroidota bacterium]